MSHTTIAIAANSYCKISLETINENEEVYECQGCKSVFKAESIKSYFGVGGIGCPHCSCSVEKLIRGKAIILE